MSSIVAWKFSPNPRANALADILEEGARALATFAKGLTESEWQARILHDGRKIGVVVVSTSPPCTRWRSSSAQTLAGGEAVRGVTWDDLPRHECRARQGARRGHEEGALELLEKNGAGGRGGGRALSDRSWPGSLQISLYSDAPLTCQFILEESRRPAQLSPSRPHPEPL